MGRTGFSMLIASPLTLTPNSFVRLTSPSASLSTCQMSYQRIQTRHTLRRFANRDKHASGARELRLAGFNKLT